MGAIRCFLLGPDSLFLICKSKSFAKMICQTKILYSIFCFCVNKTGELCQKKGEKTRGIGQSGCTCTCVMAGMDGII